VQPLLLVFEDLHWIDTETQALLDSLVESVPTARLLLLVNYRPEYQHGWGSKTYYRQLRLDPLLPASAEEFLAALLGNTPSLVPLKPLLIARTGGNPFFLEESVRTLVETGMLVGAPGAYRLAQPLASLQIPATVQAVLAARIDRLPPEEKHMLQTAAVIGTEVPLPLLQAIAELPEADLYRGFIHLQAAEFLYETRLFPEHEFTFKHALTHEVVTTVCSKSGDGCCTHGSSRPSKPSPQTAWPSRWNGWHTMPCAARRGTRPWPTTGRPGPG
jgi:predicted ATPase